MLFLHARSPAVCSAETGVHRTETTDEKARENPDSSLYRTLIVRVWGFSAVFVELSPALQERVLSRTEHGLGP